MNLFLYFLYGQLYHIANFLGKHGFRSSEWHPAFDFTSSSSLTYIVLIIVGCRFWHLDICNICPVRPVCLSHCVPDARGIQPDLTTTLSIYPIRQIKVSRVFHYVRCSVLPSTSLYLWPYLYLTQSSSSFISFGLSSPWVLVVNLRLLDAHGRKRGLSYGYLVGQVVERGAHNPNAQREKVGKNNKCLSIKNNL